jgi:heme-degrading monooxygenase HmoA
MATVYVLHRVEDYGRWREVYDSVGEIQKTGGVLDDAVFRAEGDPNNVLVMHRFGSLDAARAYFENPQVADAIREAGVDETSVRIEFYQEA